MYSKDGQQNDTQTNKQINSRRPNIKQDLAKRTRKNVRTEHKKQEGRNIYMQLVVVSINNNATRACRVLLTQIYKAVLVQNSAFANHLSMVHPNEEKCSKLYHFHTLNRTDCNTAGNSEKRKHNGQPLSFDPNLNTHKREEVNEGQR
jgi:hypothetical protein